MVCKLIFEGKSMIKKILVLFFIFYSVSCSTTNENRISEADNVDKFVESEPSKKPSWLSLRNGEKKGKFHYFIGESTDKNSKEDALKTAFLSGLSGISMYFGSKVQSQVKDFQAETNGKYSYFIGQQNSITGKPITLKNTQKDKEYVEKWVREEKTVFDAKVLISVPADEMIMLEKEVKGLTGWGIMSDDKNIAKELELFIKSYDSSGRHNLVPDKTVINNVHSVNDIAERSDTAYFFRLIFAKNILNLENGWKADVKITLDHISLIEKTVLSSKMESSTYVGKTQEEAVSEALKLAIRKLKTVSTEKEVYIASGFKIDKLQNVAVASFGILTVTEGQQSAKNQRVDDLDITTSFEKSLMGAGISIADGKTADNEIKTAGTNVYELIESDIFKSLDLNIDAEVLIIGRYTVWIGEDSSVTYQQIRIRGFEIKSGELVFDINVSDDTSGRAVPGHKKFSAFVAKFLVDSLKGEK